MDPIPIGMIRHEGCYIVGTDIGIIHGLHSTRVSFITGIKYGFGIPRIIFAIRIPK